MKKTRREQGGRASSNLRVVASHVSRGSPERDRPNRAVWNARQSGPSGKFGVWIAFDLGRRKYHLRSDEMRDESFLFEIAKNVCAHRHRTESLTKIKLCRSRYYGLWRRWFIGFRGCRCLEYKIASSPQIKEHKSLPALSHNVTAARIVGCNVATFETQSWFTAVVRLRTSVLRPFVTRRYRLSAAECIAISAYWTVRSCGKLLI